MSTLSWVITELVGALFVGTAVNPSIGDYQTKADTNGEEKMVKKDEQQVLIIYTDKKHKILPKGVQLPAK